jgi:phosphotransferase system HPr-like phosphotransfer protein
MVDAKSILGVISLGYGYVRDLKISNSGDDMEKLMGDLEPYIA